MSQDNITKNIANGSGSAVRSDMNNSLGDLNTANSGTVDPIASLSTGAFWFDTNVNDLKVKYNSVWNIVWSKNIVLGTSGTVVAGGDTDIVSTFGRNTLGSIASDVASFSHFDHSTTTNFAIKEDAAGQTTVNSASTQPVIVSQNGTEIGRFQSDNTDDWNLRLGSAPSITTDTFKTGIATAIGDVEVWQIEGTSQANLHFVDSGAPVDQKMVQMKNDGGLFQIRSITDAFGLNLEIMSFDFTGSDVIIRTENIPTSNAGLSSGEWYRDGAGANVNIKIV